MAASSRKKVTLRQLQQMKAERRPIAALGVYDAPMAAIADEIGFELFVIGNSGPMSLFGYRDSSRVRAEDLFYMTQAVSRATSFSLIVATLPYMSYLVSKEEGLRTAARFVSEAGADCVQCHGDRYSTENVAAIVRAGIPVLAHLGLQSVRKTAQSGFGVQGRTAEAAARIVEDAERLADAGVFAFILELVPMELAGFLREYLPVPVLSLGSGPDADGIYQVSADVVGFSVFRRPRSATGFADARVLAERGIRDYVERVRARTYPDPTERRRMSASELRGFHERGQSSKA
jgi:3-methyl-2-oxobutanoate hydroxymethyltransferase